MNRREMLRSLMLLGLAAVMPVIPGCGPSEEEKRKDDKNCNQNPNDPSCQKTHGGGAGSAGYHGGSGYAGGGSSARSGGSSSEESFSGRGSSSSSARGFSEPAPHAPTNIAPRVTAPAPSFGGFGRAVGGFGG